MPGGSARVARASAVLAALLLVGSTASATLITLSHPSGLSAEVEFTLVDATTLEIRAKNTSTGTPSEFESADQILSGISWDFGEPGVNGDAMILSGSVVNGPSSASFNFDTGDYGPGFDVSGEWGFGNTGGTGALTNFFSSHTSRATPFGGANLDGPVSTNGPAGGLVADPLLIAIGGLGAIQDEIIATLTLSEPLANLDFLDENFVRVEFGSDALFITTPEPGTGLLFALGLVGLGLRRRRRR